MPPERPRHLPSREDFPESEGSEPEGPERAREGQGPLRDGARQVLELARPIPEPSGPPVPWQTLFAGGSQNELLVRFTVGDPLGLWPRAARLARATCRVVHLDRLHLRTVARAAYLAPLYRGRPQLETWLLERAREGLRELLIDDLRQELERRPVDPRDHWQHAMMAEALGMEPGLARRAAVVFNGLAAPLRRLLFALVFEGRALAELAAEGWGHPAALEAQARVGLQALSRLDPPGLRDLVTLEAEL